MKPRTTFAAWPGIAAVLIFSLAAAALAQDRNGSTAADSTPQMVGHRLMELGLFQEAVDYYRGLLQKDPDNVQACVSLSTSLCKLNQKEAAVSQLGQCIARAPETAAFYVARGLCEQEMSEEGVAKAEADYRRAVDLEPGNASAHNQLGLIYQARGDHPGAMAEFRAALDADPGFAVAYNNLGASLIAQGRYLEAIAAFQKAVAAAADLKGLSIYHNLGIAFLYAGKLPEAEAAFLLETAINPDHQESHLNLGNLYLMAGRYNDAGSEYQRVLLAAPDQPDALVSLGASYFFMGNYGEAVADLERAARLYPDSALAHQYLSLVYETLGDVARAAEEAKKAEDLGYDPRKNPIPR